MIFEFYLRVVSIRWNGREEKGRAGISISLFFSFLFFSFRSQRGKGRNEKALSSESLNHVHETSLSFPYHFYSTLGTVFEEPF